MKKSAKLNIKRIMTGAAIAVAIYLALAALLALAAERGSVGEEAVKTCVALSAAFSVLVGSKTATLREEEPTLVIALCAAAFAATVTLCGFLAYDGIGAKSAAMLIVYSAAGALGAMLTGKRKAKRKRRSHK